MLNMIKKNTLLFKASTKTISYIAENIKNVICTSIK